MNKVLRNFFSFIVRDERFLFEQRLCHRQQGRLQNLMWERASRESADFVEEHLHDCLVFKNQQEIWKYTVKKIDERFRKGVCLEFGVGGGASINFFSKRLPGLSFFGFDSFFGLKEDWSGTWVAKGHFSRSGVAPKINKNVGLVSGWFDRTIPVFLEKNPELVSDLCFIHIDSDTYDAAKTVFYELGEHIKPGMFILFDELIGYPNWKNGEFKALNEARSKFGFSFEYRAFSSDQALIEILPSG